MAINVMTYLFDKKGKPERMIDKISIAMSRLKLYKARDYWTLEDENNNVVGAFYSIEGPKIVTDFLSWATNIRGKDTVSSTVNTDKFGRIINIKEES